MNISKQSWIVISSLFVFITAFSIKVKISTVIASTSTHIVISEIQIAETKANDHNQFVELYNPLTSQVDLSGWRLARETAKGSKNDLVKSMSGIIPAHGFFLITPQVGYTGSAPADEKYSTTKHFIGNNNTVLLYSDAGKTIVDKVGMGNAKNFNGSAAVNPDKGKSIERKANAGATSASMSSGGSDEFAGNGEDTGNNSADFVMMNVPDPKNVVHQQRFLLSLQPRLSRCPLQQIRLL